MNAAAKLLVRYLDELAQITDEPGKLTRTFLSPAMRRASARVAEWMRAAGLATREDTTGNLIGRLESPAGARARTLLLGSHLDTVRDAGRFDGALGVLLSIVALAELRRRGVALPFAVEVLGFSEEEGVRFASAYLGSKGYTGQLRDADLNFTDAEGVTIRAALEAHNGAPFALPKPAHRKSDLLGYVEVHIEQGPVLEARKLAVGVVTAIAGQTRAKLVFNGHAGHAGTTPMNLRRDALAGAAEFTLAAESLAKRTPGLVATVGTMAVAPGAANVIPAEAAFSLDLRHPRDAVRRSALRRLRGIAERIARRRKLTLAWTTTQDNAAVTCSPALATALTASVRAVQGRSLALPSGAGHDAVVLSALTPVAMLFVRSRAGLSHHPDEYSSPADLGVALDVLIDFIERLARTHSS
jgi:allantoate deiminase